MQATTIALYPERLLSRDVFKFLHLNTCSSTIYHHSQWWGQIRQTEFDECIQNDQEEEEDAEESEGVVEKKGILLSLQFDQLPIDTIKLRWWNC